MQGFGPEGAIDGDRFATGPGSAWKGPTQPSETWWQVRFPEPRDVGAILQVLGDHAFVLRNAPKRYVWQFGQDGRNWCDLDETRTTDERRTFRIHRLRQVRRAKYLRLLVSESQGPCPVLREVEFYPATESRIDFGDWAVVVSTIDKPDLPGAGVEFVKLIRQCDEWKHLQVQQVWLDTFNEAFVSAEPRPLCAFLSGNYKDWCQVAREPWRGTQEILKNRRLPIWAACGGAQGLAILSTAGVDKEWDCPHCRDPKNPKLPIYTHIGHTGKRACGDYACCIAERGIYNVRKVADDPVFEGLPREFQIRESHVGQIEWAPDGWVLIATAGRGALTRTQCLRVKDRYIYAAQFHIESYEGTLQNSQRILSNFLSLAKQWGGYNPQGPPVPPPQSFPASETPSTAPRAIPSGGGPSSRARIGVANRSFFAQQHLP